MTTNTKTLIYKCQSCDWQGDWRECGKKIGLPNPKANIDETTVWFACPKCGEPTEPECMRLWK